MLGRSLSGIDSDGNLYEDPAEEHEACVIIRLTVTKDLEPIWTVHRPQKNAQAQEISSSTRQVFGCLKVDDRIDAHLRWSRTSALGRLTERKHGTNELLVNARREARNAVAGSVPAELADLALTIKAKLHEVGSGDFVDLRPGLDQSLPNNTGNLALYEGPVPLTSFGLGSRRLAGVATQQLAHPESGVLLVDEVEYGLEPHRLINLITSLRQPGAYALALVTTHSPTVLRYVGAEGLSIVRRSTDGTVRVQTFGSSNIDVQKLLRSTPEAFLARRIVVCEGKTEYGICLQLIEEWDRSRSVSGDPLAAGMGVVAVDAMGGSKAIVMADQLNRAGYDVILFMDSDVGSDRIGADRLGTEGVSVVRWDTDDNTERAICNALDAGGLTDFIARAAALSDDPNSAPGNFLEQMKTHGLPAQVDSLRVDDWSKFGTDLESARAAIAGAAHKSGWFKNVDKGRQLAILITGLGIADSDTGRKLDSLQSKIYRNSGSDSSGSAVPDPGTAGDRV